MNTYMKTSNLTKSEHRRKRFRRLKPTCAMNCFPPRNPLGHVVIYAPALACELRLVHHHIGDCRKLGTDF